LQRTVRDTLLTVTTAAPSLQELGDFALAAERNASRLLADAELLLRHERWPSAYSLAVLAFEEVGKSWLCVIPMMVPDDIRPEWPFRQLTASHSDKLMAALLMGRMLRAFIRGEDMIASMMEVAETVEILAREQNKAKQRGLYTDLSDGVICEPQSIRQSEAAHMVRNVRRLRDYGAFLTDPGFIAALMAAPAADYLQEARQLGWDALVAGAKEGTAEGMAVAMRGLFEETGEAEDLPAALREFEQEALARRIPAPRRTQPRRLPRASRR
jgi:AbiV family abortive infection protein